MMLGYNFGKPKRMGDPPKAKLFVFCEELQDFFGCFIESISFWLKALQFFF